MGSGRPPSCVEDVLECLELMQHIQSRLPMNDAARTSVLSKAWLHAWSTIPTLRFHVGEEEHLKVVGVERTLSRYLRDNIPIESFELHVDIDNEESAYVTENWIRTVATKAASTLKQLSLSVELPGTSLRLPDEILSVAKNLTKLSVSATSRHRVHSVWMKTPVNNIINCVSLREVVLRGVRISQEVLDGIFSSCSLLEKIELYLDVQDKGHNTMIKIKNLARLHEIRIYSMDGNSTDLEISGVPNLWLFKFDLYYNMYDQPYPLPFSAYSISLGSTVTDLVLHGLIIDESSLEMIKSGFPFLESLTLGIEYCPLPSFHFTCGSLKKLSLVFYPRDIVAKLIDVQVYAPKLLDFFFQGWKLPSLSFPVSTLVQTTFNLSLYRPVDVSFFLNMREALMLSTKCDLFVCIRKYYMNQQSGIDLDDLLEFETDYECCSPTFDAFFEICHPKHVLAKPHFLSKSTSHFFFFELMLREVVVKKNKNKNKNKKKKQQQKPTKKTSRRAYWTRYLKHVEIKHDEKWETLTSSHRTTLNGGPHHFKLNWCGPPASPLLLDW